MKKFKLFGLIAISLFAFASCDLVEDVKDAIDEIQDDQDPAYTESENGLEISVSYKRSGIGIYHIAQFAVNGGDTICTSFVTKTTYFSEALAKEAYDHAIKDLDEKEKARFTLDGKELTVNHPDNIGLEKATIRFGLKTVYEGYKKGGEIIEDIEIPTDGDGDGGQVGPSTLDKFNAQYNESEDGLQLTLSYYDFTQSIARVREATFMTDGTDTLCVTYAFTDTYAREDIAQYEFEQHYINYEQEYRYEINGAVITHVEPDYVRTPKARIKQQMLYDYNTMNEMDAM